MFLVHPRLVSDFRFRTMVRRDSDRHVRKVLRCHNLNFLFCPSSAMKIESFGDFLFDSVFTEKAGRKE